MGAAPAGRHVLVVDDHELMREALAALVREVEPAARVSGAATLERALALARCDPPDLAVLDLSLPDGRGEELLRLLRRERPGLPALLLSADAGAAAPARLLGQFCAKSADHDALVAALQQLMDAPGPALSAAQLQLLGLLCAGLPNREIGRRLGLDEAATRARIDAVFRCLRVRNRSQAVAAARAAGLMG